MDLVVWVDLVWIWLQGSSLVIRALVAPAARKMRKITKTKEQTKIGKLFQQLDTLINQQQSQLTKLNNIKQAMLAKMFV